MELDCSWPKIYDYEVIYYCVRKNFSKKIQHKILKMDEKYVDKVINKLLQGKIDRDDLFIQCLADAFDINKLIEILESKLKIRTTESKLTACIDILCYFSLRNPKFDSLLPLCKFLIQYNPENQEIRQLELIRETLTAIVDSETDEFNKQIYIFKGELGKFTDQPIYSTKYEPLIMACFAAKNKDCFENVFKDLAELLKNNKQFDIIKLFSLNILLSTQAQVELDDDIIIEYFQNTLAKNSKSYAEILKSGSENESLIIIDLILSNLLFFKEVKSISYLFDCVAEIQNVFFQINNDQIRTKIIKIMELLPLDSFGTFKRASQISFLFGILVFPEIYKYTDDEFRFKFLQDRLLEETDYITADLMVKKYKEKNLVRVVEMIANTSLANSEDAVKMVFVDNNELKKMDQEVAKNINFQMVYNFENFFKKCEVQELYDYVLNIFAKLCARNVSLRSYMTNVWQFFASRPEFIANQLYDTYLELIDEELNTIWDSKSSLEQNEIEWFDNFSRNFTEIKKEIYHLIVNLDKNVQLPKWKSNMLITADILYEYISYRSSDIPIRAYYRINDKEFPENFDITDINLENLDNFLYPYVKKSTIYIALASLLPESSSAFKKAITIYKSLKSEVLIHSTFYNFCYYYKHRSDFLNYMRIETCKKQMGIEVANIILRSTFDIYDDFIYNFNEFSKYYPVEQLINENKEHIINMLNTGGIRLDSDFCSILAKSPPLIDHYKEIISISKDPESAIKNTIITACKLEKGLTPFLDNIISYVVKNYSESLNACCSAFTDPQDAEIGLIVLTHAYALSKGSNSYYNSDFSDKCMDIVINYILEMQKMKKRSFNDLIFEESLLSPIQNFLRMYYGENVKDNENVAVLIGQALQTKEIQYLINKTKSEKFDDGVFIAYMIIYSSDITKIPADSLREFLRVNFPDPYKEILLNSIISFINTDLPLCFPFLLENNPEFADGYLLYSKENFRNFMKNMSNSNHSDFINKCSAKNIHVPFLNAYFNPEKSQKLNELQLNYLIQDFLETADVLAMDERSLKVFECILDNAKMYNYMDSQIIDFTLEFMKLMGDKIPEKIIDNLWQHDYDERIPFEKLHSMININTIAKYYQLNSTFLFNLLVKYGYKKDVAIYLITEHEPFALMMILARTKESQDYSQIPIDHVFKAAATRNDRFALQILTKLTGKSTMNEIISYLLAKRKFNHLEELFNILIECKKPDIIKMIINDENSKGLIDLSYYQNAATIFSERNVDNSYIIDILLHAELLCN